MAKSCIACGKNISLLGVRIPLLGTEDLVICLECFEKMPPILNDLYQKKVYPTKSELLQIKDDVVQQLKISNYNQDTINVVTKFLDDKIAKAKDPENSEIGRILKKCPVCKKNVNYDEVRRNILKRGEELARHKDYTIHSASKSSRGLL